LPRPQIGWGGGPAWLTNLANRLGVARDEDLFAESESSDQFGQLCPSFFDGQRLHGFSLSAWLWLTGQFRSCFIVSALWFTLLLRRSDNSARDELKDFVKLWLQFTLRLITLIPDRAYHCWWNATSVR
jgi:hypothetical protein